MAQFHRLLLFILFCGVVGCSLMSAVAPTDQLIVTPTDDLSKSPPVRTPQPTNTLHPSPVPTLPPEVQNLLPPGASASEHPGWSRELTFPGTQVALPYRLPDFSYSLALLDDLTSPGSLYWDLHTDPLTIERTWKDIRALPRAPTTLLSFVGLDDKDHWWIGVVMPPSPNGQSAAMLALLPVDGPENVFYDYTRESNDAIPEYYVVEDGTLSIYRWSDTGASLLYRMDNAPTDAVSPWKADFTGADGDYESEVVLRWYRWSESFIEARKYQFIRSERGDDYVSLGMIDSGFQHIDADHDGVREFLYPKPAVDPEQWDVIGWNGAQFAQTAPILRPASPNAQPVDSEHLPPLPAHLYFRRGDEYWRWPKEGGPFQQVDSMPAASVDVCSGAVERLSLHCWSPGMRYALVEIPGVIEGGHTAIYDTVTDKTIEIPDTFVYTSGWLTFAWDPEERFLIMAGADGYDGLYRIDLPGVTKSLLLDLRSGFILHEGLGAVDPFVFSDGSIGFAIQGSDASLYPGPGIYRLAPDGNLVLLADLLLPLPPGEGGDRWAARQLLWSPDGMAYVYPAPSEVYKPLPYKQLLLGFSDGNALYDLSQILGDAENFTWVP